MFQIKDFASISASMVNYAKAVQKRITDFSVGSVARTMLEAPAVEIDELYQQMFIGLQEAIPVAIYNSFDFARLSAQPSTGLVRITIQSSAVQTVIPAGSLFAPSGYGVDFVSSADGIIAAGGTYVDVRVQAKVAGAVGNIPSGTAFVLTPNVSGLVSAVAQGDFVLGSEEETDAQRKARFAAFISSLPRGTVAALKYGMSLAGVLDASGLVVERVAFSEVVEPYLSDPLQPPALVRCYIHNGVDGASSALIADVVQRLNGYYDTSGNPVAGWKAAGVKVEVIAATTTAVDVTGVLTLLTGYVSATVIAEVESAISAYINALGIGEDVVYAEIVAAAMNVSGVANFVPSAPTADVAIAATAKALAGTLTVTA